MSGAAGAVSYSLAFGSNDAYAINASTTAGGADLTLNFGDAGWDVGASMPLGAATVGVTINDASEWEVSLGTSLEGVGLDMKFDESSNWEMDATYDAGDVSVAFGTDNLGVWSIDADYDMGNGVTIGAGTSDADGDYADVSMDLGGGASAGITYGSQAGAGPDDIDEGTTISVSFSF